MTVLSGHSHWSRAVTWHIRPRPPVKVKSILHTRPTYRAITADSSINRPNYDAGGRLSVDWLAYYPIECTSDAGDKISMLEDHYLFAARSWLIGQLSVRRDIRCGSITADSYQSSLHYKYASQTPIMIILPQCVVRITSLVQTQIVVLFTSPIQSPTWRSAERPAYTHRNRETAAFTKVFIILYILVNYIRRTVWCLISAFISK